MLVSSTIIVLFFFCDVLLSIMTNLLTDDGRPSLIGSSIKFWWDIGCVKCEKLFFSSFMRWGSFSIIHPFSPFLFFLIWNDRKDKRWTLFDDHCVMVRFDVPCVCLVRSVQKDHWDVWFLYLNRILRDRCVRDHIAEVFACVRFGFIGFIHWTWGKRMRTNKWETIIKSSKTAAPSAAIIVASTDRAYQFVSHRFFLIYIFFSLPPINWADVNQIPERFLPDHERVLPPFTLATTLQLDEDQLIYHLRPNDCSHLYLTRFHGGCLLSRLTQFFFFLNNQNNGEDYDHHHHSVFFDQDSVSCLATSKIKRSTSTMTMTTSEHSIKSQMFILLVALPCRYDSWLLFIFFVALLLSPLSLFFSFTLMKANEDMNRLYELLVYWCLVKFGLSITHKPIGPVDARARIRTRVL